MIKWVKKNYFWGNLAFVPSLSNPKVPDKINFHAYLLSTKNIRDNIKAAQNLYLNIKKGLLLLLVVINSVVASVPTHGIPFLNPYEQKVNTSTEYENIAARFENPGLKLSYLLFSFISLNSPLAVFVVFTITSTITGQAGAFI